MLGSRVGMNAHAGARRRQCAGERYRRATAHQVVTDQEHCRYTLACGALHDGVAVAVECGIHQVGVGVNQSRHASNPGRGGEPPPMTNVNSPRGGWCSKCARAADAVPRKISSKCLVNSRPIATGRSAPSEATTSFNAAMTRCGDSNTSKVTSLSACWFK